MAVKTAQVATEPDYKFELAIGLGELEIAREIAGESASEAKWKQLGELAMSAGDLSLAESCMGKAKDLSGLMLVYSATGNASGMKVCCVYVMSTVSLISYRMHVPCAKIG